MTDNRSGQEQWAAMLPRLAELAKENLSSRLIAIKLSEEFGFAVTRGAVMGKLHREGFRPSGVNPPGPKPGSRVPVVNLMRQKAKPRPLPEDVRVFGVPQPVHILNLKHNQCRWVIGPASQMLYCGQPTESGISWCPEHERVVYGKSNVRSERVPQY